MMRLSAIVMLLCALFTPGLFAAGPQNPDLTGERDDEHGDIRWKSSVKNSGTTWEYAHELENRNDKRNCRVNWEAIQWKSTLFPKQKAPAGTRQVVQRSPAKEPGELRYNGGPAAGEGVEANAPAWMPERDKKQYGPTEASAQLVVEVKDTLYPIDLTGSSQLRRIGGNQFEVTYHLSIKPTAVDNAEQLGAVSFDVRKLLTLINVEWTSIPEDVWKGMEPAQFAYGWVKEGQFLQFDKSGEKEDSFELKVSVNLRGEPSMNVNAIEFSVGQGDDRSVLARACIPAYATPLKPEKK